MFHGKFTKRHFKLAFNTGDHPGSRLSGLVRGCSLPHRRNRPIGAGGPTDGSNRGRALTHRPGVLQRFVLIPKKKPRW
jgi:hypothetical protein